MVNFLRQLFDCSLRGSWYSYDVIKVEIETCDLQLLLSQVYSRKGTISCELICCLATAMVN